MALIPHSNSELASVFKNTMILQPDFCISGVSQNISDLLSYSYKELVGQNITMIMKPHDFETLVKELSSGLLPETVIALIGSGGNDIEVNISGFVSCEVCGIDGFIILQIYNHAEGKTLQEQLQRKREELDRFIYSTSHDLRGPLATIKGLINLLRIKGGDEDFERLLQLLQAHANKLDDRLFKLVYLTEADSMQRQPNFIIHFSKIETHLRRVFEKNAFVDFLEFHFISPLESVEGVNEVLLESLLENLVLFILSLPMTAVNARIILGFRVNESDLKITIEVQGFEVSEPVLNGLKRQEFIYTDIAHYPMLINFYAAQKIGIQLKAETRLEFLPARQHQLIISMPIRKA
jgi:hypothetical protein